MCIRDSHQPAPVWFRLRRCLTGHLLSLIHISFAAARQQAVTELGCQGSLLRQPNNTLGVEYLKALLRLESPINPCGLPRDLSLKSASQLRADLDNPSWRKHVPSALLPLYDSVPKYRFV